MQQVLWAWIPLLGVDKVAALLRLIAGQCTRQHHSQFLRQLKIALYQAIQEHALQYLDSRVSLQLLPGGVSWTWLNKLTTVPKLAVNGVARFAVLRWAVNEDDDECLRLRTTGSLQAEQSCVLCGTRTRLYPLGLSFGPACEKCCHDNNINATTLFGTDMWGIPDNSPWHPVAGKLRGEFSVPEAWPNRETSLPPCVACGLGDNTTQHWARFCIIPVLVAATLASSPQHVRSLDQIARSNVAGCVIASHVLHQFRRLLLEHGGMQHSTSSVALNITEWLTRLYDNCLQAIPTRFLDAQQSPIRPKNVGPTDTDHPCHMQITHNEAVIQSVALPDVVCTATSALDPEQPVATLPLGHPWLKLISPTNAHRAGLQTNVCIESADNEPQPSLCQIIAIRPIGVDQMILADPPDKGQNKTPIQIVGQFDGSCHRTERLGGAGYVIYTIEGGISRVLACRAVALPQCSDNVESEILACLFLVEEIATLIRRIASDRDTSPKVVIQGDILPVVKYFQFAGRLRRIDMTPPLEQIRTLVSLHIPHAMFLYQPRVANIVADNLAGQASDFMIGRYRHCPTSFNRDAGPVSIRPTFPAPLLQIGGFHIQCPAQPWAHPALTLVEKPKIDHGLLRKHVTKHPHHRQLIEAYLSPCVLQSYSVEIDYSPKAPDNLGRKYCCTIGGQRMPRAVRTLLFGQSHSEVDLKGSFYELVRRLGLQYAPDHLPLPAIDELRTVLARDPYIQAAEDVCPNTIKRLPLRVINSTPDSAFRSFPAIIKGSPNAVTQAIMSQLWMQAKALTDQLLPRLRPTFHTGQADSTFRLLEHFEVQIVEDTIKELLARHPTQSLVWLHDGFLVAPPPPDHVIRQIEESVLSRYSLYFGQTWFRVHSLSVQHAEYVTSLRGVVCAPPLAIARRGLPRSNYDQRIATGSPQTCLTRLEALAKLRARRERNTRTA